MQIKIDLYSLQNVTCGTMKSKYILYHFVISIIILKVSCKDFCLALLFYSVRLATNVKYLRIYLPFVKFNPLRENHPFSSAIVLWCWRVISRFVIYRFSAATKSISFQQLDLNLFPLLLSFSVFFYLLFQVGCVFSKAIGCEAFVTMLICY